MTPTITWLFTVALLLNGVWTPGSQVDGWSPLPYPTEAVCLERLDFAQQRHADHLRVELRAVRLRFACTPITTTTTNQPQPQLKETKQ